MKSSTSFAEKYASAILVAAVFMLSLSLFTIEQYHAVPLQGAAMPMYGSLPNRITVKKPVIRKASQTSSRKALRVQSSSSKSRR